MNSNLIGNIGIGRAIKHFTSLGWIVSIPLNDSQDYDLVLDTGDGKLQRIQVKYTSSLRSVGVFDADIRVKSRYTVCVKRQTKRGDDVHFDYVFVATADGSDWLIPRSAIYSRLNLNPNGKAARYLLNPSLAGGIIIQDDQPSPPPA